MQNKPVLAITMGDPAGVGPEVTVKIFGERKIFEICRPLVIGDFDVMNNAKVFVGSKIALHRIHDVSEAKFQPDSMDVLDLNNVDLSELRLGKVAAMAGEAAFECIVTGIKLALAGKIDGIVTNPIHKEAINLAGHRFAGHTEILAHYTKTKHFGMLLAFGNLRVIHVSTHVPLRKACDLVKKERIVEVIRMLHDACRQLGIEVPRIGVAGLNPHASDGGLFGDEEAEEITPAIEQARAMGFTVSGPIPPDTLFPKAKAGVYDGCVAMYHDQGHIAFKFDTFQWDNQKQRVKRVRGVNVTLGLPIIRTSVDHGTAFDIAGKGIASTETLMDAIEYAAKMALHRKK
jgi:4-hydroxythreonine-4-phosphate dehydrogenase